MRAHLIVVFAVLASLVARADCHDLLPVDTDDYPWSSIGKFYNGAGSSCTGVVVSQTEVVTAAHCLYNRRNGVLLEAPSLHFLIGYRQVNIAKICASQNSLPVPTINPIAPKRQKGGIGQY